ncbi:hypothetical protein BGZ91_009980, partial [Linnemannia elongata]
TPNLRIQHPTLGVRGFFDTTDQYPVLEWFTIEGEGEWAVWWTTTSVICFLPHRTSWFASKHVPVALFSSTTAAAATDAVTTSLALEAIQQLLTPISPSIGDIDRGRDAVPGSAGGSASMDKCPCGRVPWV